MRRTAIVVAGTVIFGVLAVVPSSAMRPDPVAVLLFRLANARLLERERTGVHARVALQHDDGTTTGGYDDYLNASPIRLREVRSDYRAVAVVDRVCVDQPVGPYCADDTIELGLRPFDDGQVVAAHRLIGICNGELCRRVRIELSDMVVFAAGPGMSPPENAGQPATTRVLDVTIRADGLPVVFEESRIGDDGDGPRVATFRFDYATPIAPIELPADTSHFAQL
ncbi:hypothetical protein [Lysobacter claricitrinus]|uniref:hypothetical protein n=1 Tax=Lysobacter claricitrinus TaxID=3367728 RepID=UPI0037DBBB91